ncbi:MAG TPA: amidohydrolase family protein [Burkholderiales bacterium]|nr:amidohydrolase family protein [Burkholderiales bacterium]
MNYSVISADNHIIEPRDLFVSRMPRAFRDRAPRVAPGADGGDGWSWKGEVPSRTFGIEAVAGQGAGYKASGLRWEEILPGNYDGAAHLADMDKDGVDAAVVFPQVTINAYAEPDRPFALAVLGTYNDWLLDDFQKVDPKRLVGLCMLPVNDGMDTAVAEMDRCLAKGARGFFIPGIPKRPYFDPYYEPLWKAASAAGVPLCLHRTFGGTTTDAIFRHDQPGVNVAGIVIRFFSAVDHFTYLIYSGVFERNPGLKVVDAEVNCGWVEFWKAMLDLNWEQQKHWARFPFSHRPSDALGRNLFVSVLNDEVGFAAMQRDPQIASMSMYSIDYPHSVTLWPNSKKYIAELTQGLDPKLKRDVLAGNAARVFGLA